MLHIPMKYLFLLSFALFTSIIQSFSQTEIIEPLAVFNDPSGKIKVTARPNIMDGAMVVPYVFQVEGQDYNVRTNYLEEKLTLEDVKSQLEMQFSFNPSAKMLYSDEYKGFYLIGISTEIYLDEETTLYNVVELAMTIVDGDFIVGIDCDFDNPSKINPGNIKKIIDGLSFVSLKEMDQMLGYPLSLEAFKERAEIARISGEDSQILSFRFNNQFSFEQYFDAWRKMSTYPFTLDDFATAFFEKNGKDPLSTIKKLHHFPLDYTNIEGLLPGVRQIFMDTLSNRIFHSAGTIIDVQLTNEDSKTFSIQYFDNFNFDNEEKQSASNKTKLISLVKKEKHWDVVSIDLPKPLESNYELQGSFEFIQLVPGIATVYSPLEMRYYIKTLNNNSEWKVISQQPVSKDEYVMIIPNCGISNDGNFNLNYGTIYFQKRNQLNQASWDKIETFLGEKNLLGPNDIEEARTYNMPYPTIEVSKKQIAKRTPLIRTVYTACSTDARLYSSKPLQTDLNNNGKPEFTILYISDGQLVEVASYEVSDNQLIKLNDANIKKSAEKLVQCHNLKAYSLFISE
ncbi:MAG: Clr5 domain-containing protein [Flavobacteriales bacterium]